MREPAEAAPDVTALLQELEAARARLVQAHERCKGGKTALKAFALCDEVERLCEMAVRATEPELVPDLLASVRGLINELQKLLGVH